jgi:imidazolonepropionase-like amidohydrolase
MYLCWVLPEVEETSLGGVAPGYEADLVAVERDPRQDTSSSSRPDSFVPLFLVALPYTVKRGPVVGGWSVWA